MDQRTKKLITAGIYFLVFSAFLPDPRIAGAKDGHHTSVPAVEVFITGNEQAIVDSFTNKGKTPGAEKFPNVLDHALSVLLLKGYPQPDVEKIAQGVVISLCKEFERQTQDRVPDEERKKWISTAFRAKRFEDVLKNIDARKRKGLDRTKLIESGLRGMVEGPGPRFAWLLTGVQAAGMKEMIKNRKTPATEPGVIGIQLDRWPVVQVMPDSPAAGGGLQSGDLILAIDGKDVSGVKTAADALRHLKGPSGKKVTLRVKRGKETLTFQVRRTAAGTAGIRWEVVEPGIVYIKIPTFEGSGIADTVKQIIHAHLADRARVLMLDLRDNPGGRPEEANGVADIFLNDRYLQVFEFPGGKRVTIKSHPGGLDVAIVILVNKNSYSGAEMLAMALHDNDRATLVGEATAGALFGKDMVELGNGQAIIFRTEPIVLSPRGNDYSKAGVQPDIVVRDAAGPYGDPILRAAIEFSRTKIQMKKGQDRLIR